MKKLIVFAAVILILTANINAQKKDYSREKGYVDFSSLMGFNEEDMNTEVHLDEGLLKMASDVADDNAEVSDVLGGIKLVKVNGYNISGNDLAGVKKKMSALEDKLTGSGWERIVMTRQKKDWAYVMIKKSGNRVEGLVVCALDISSDPAEENELVLVNIVGELDMEKIGKLSGSLDIPELDKLKSKREDKK